jgi:hypothetical protein
MYPTHTHTHTYINNKGALSYHGLIKGHEFYM